MHPAALNIEERKHRSGNAHTDHEEQAAIDAAECADVAAPLVDGSALPVAFDGVAEPLEHHLLLRLGLARPIGGIRQYIVLPVPPDLFYTRHRVWRVREVEVGLQQFDALF